MSDNWCPACRKLHELPRRDPELGLVLASNTCEVLLIDPAQEKAEE